MSRTEYWLATVTQRGVTDKLKDGPHDGIEGAHQAYYLYQRLRLIDPKVKYSIVTIQHSELVCDRTGVNEDAINTINSIRKGGSDE